MRVRLSVTTWLEPTLLAAAASVVILVDSNCCVLNLCVCLCTEPFGLGGWMPFITTAHLFVILSLPPQGLGKQHSRKEGKIINNSLKRGKGRQFPAPLFVPPFAPSGFRSVSGYSSLVLYYHTTFEFDTSVARCSQLNPF